MSAAQDYYNQVLSMGHSPENALAYTRQHYPDFIPGVAAPVAAPVVAPVSQQPVPAAQPVAQPAIALPQRSPHRSPCGRACRRGAQRLFTDGEHAASSGRYDADDVGRRWLHRVRPASLDGGSVQSFVDR